MSISSVKYYKILVAVVSIYFLLLIMNKMNKINENKVEMVTEIIDSINTNHNMLLNGYNILNKRIIQIENFLDISGKRSDEKKDKKDGLNVSIDLFDIISIPSTTAKATNSVKINGKDKGLISNDIFASSDIITTTTTIPREDTEKKEDKKFEVFSVSNAGGIGSSERGAELKSNSKSISKDIIIPNLDDALNTKIVPTVSNKKQSLITYDVDNNIITTSSYDVKPITSSSTVFDKKKANNIGIKIAEEKDDYSNDRKMALLSNNNDKKCGLNSFKSNASSKSSLKFKSNKKNNKKNKKKNINKQRKRNGQQQRNRNNNKKKQYSQKYEPPGPVLDDKPDQIKCGSIDSFFDEWKKYNPNGDHNGYKEATMEYWHAPNFHGNFFDFIQQKK